MNRRRKKESPAEAAPNSGEPQVYNAAFRPDEQADIPLLVAGDVRDEIAMLRVVIRRAFTLATQFDPESQEQAANLKQAIRLVDTLSAASLRLGTLLKMQQALGESSGEITAAISQALREVAEEMGVK